MNDTLLLVLLISVAVIGAIAALDTMVIRGDGRVGPGPDPAPPRSHPEDPYLPYLLDRTRYHR